MQSIMKMRFTDVHSGQKIAFKMTDGSKVEGVFPEFSTVKVCIVCQFRVSYRGRGVLGFPPPPFPPEFHEIN